MRTIYNQAQLPWRQLNRLTGSSASFYSPLPAPPLDRHCPLFFRQLVATTFNYWRQDNQVNLPRISISFNGLTHFNSHRWGRKWGKGKGERGLGGDGACCGLSLKCHVNEGDTKRQTSWKGPKGFCVAWRGFSLGLIPFPCTPSACPTPLFVLLRFRYHCTISNENNND